MCTWRWPSALLLLLLAGPAAAQAQQLPAGPITAAPDRGRRGNGHGRQPRQRRLLQLHLADLVAAAGTREAHTQRTLGLDAEYSRAYRIVRGEVIDSRWTVPAVAAPLIGAPLAAHAAFVETRYRFTPRFFAAARADRLTFSSVRGERRFAGQPTPSDAPVTRIEAGGGVYLERNLTLRAVVQRNWRAAGLVKNRTFTSAQLAYWF